MKSVQQTTPVKPLPVKYFAVLFEGPWLFTQDPADRTRILAICPYLDPSDHKFEFGFWKDEDLSGLKGAEPETLVAGTLYKVDLHTDNLPAPDFHSLFEPAATTYSLIYLRNRKKANTLKIQNASNLRRVSFSMPAAVRAAGKLLHAPVVKGVSSNEESFHMSIGGQPANHVTLIFLYPFKDDTPALNVQGTPVAMLAGAKLHLVFRARGTSTNFVDSYTDNLHLVESFDMLRKLISVRDPKFADNAFSACDFGLYPSSGVQRFDRGDTASTEFSNKELGLPEDSPGGIEKIRIDALTLASCAAGTIVCNGDDMGE